MNMIKNIFIFTFFIIVFIAFAITVPKITLSVSQPVISYINVEIESNFKITYVGVNEINITNYNIDFYPNEYVFNNIIYKSTGRTTLIELPKENGTIYAVNGTERFPIYKIIYNH